MPFTHSPIEATQMFALGGTIIFLGAVLGVVLAVYAIYWMIFKMGKD